MRAFFRELVRLLDAAGVRPAAVAGRLRAAGLDYTDESAALWLSGTVLPGAIATREMITSLGLEPESRDALHAKRKIQPDEDERRAVAALFDSVRSKDLAAVERAARERAWLGALDQDGRPLLAHALERGDATIFSRLLELGAELTAYLAQEQVPISFVILERGSPDMVAAALRFGMVLGDFDEQGRLDIERAVLRPGDDPAVLRLALDAHPPGTGDLDLLHRAAVAAGKVNTAAALVERGATPEPAAPTTAASWHDETAEPLIFAYGKGFGVGFDPRDRDAPFLYGGSYDGMRRHSADEMLRYTFIVPELERAGFGWLIAFIRRAQADERFSLEQLRAAAVAHGCRVERGMPGY